MMALRQSDPLEYAQFSRSPDYELNGCFEVLGWPNSFVESLNEIRIGFKTNRGGYLEPFDTHIECHDVRLEICMKKPFPGAEISAATSILMCEEFRDQLEYSFKCFEDVEENEEFGFPSRKRVTTFRVDDVFDLLCAINDAYEIHYDRSDEIQCMNVSLCSEGLSQEEQTRVWELFRFEDKQSVQTN